MNPVVVQSMVLAMHFEWSRRAFTPIEALVVDHLGSKTAEKELVRGLHLTELRAEEAKNALERDSNSLHFAGTRVPRVETEKR